MERSRIPILAVTVVAIAVAAWLVFASGGAPDVPVDPLVPVRGDAPAGVVEGRVGAADEVRREVSAEDTSPAGEPRSNAGSGLVVTVVLTTTAEPVADTDVVVQQDGRWMWAPRTVVTTGADGVARFPDLAAGEWMVRTMLWGGARAEVAKGRATELVLKVQEDAVVDGTVVDPDGRPIEGASVWMSEPGTSDRGALVARTRAQGYFEVKGVHLRHGFAAWADGFAASAVYPVLGEAGQRTTLRIVLSRTTCVVVGRVVDTQGRAVRGATVLVGQEWRPADRRAPDGTRIRGPAPRETRTDRDGAFVVRHLEPGKTPLQVAAAGFGGWTGTVDVVQGPDARVDVTLLPGATVEGTFRGAGGAVQVGYVHTVGLGSVVGAYEVTAKDGTFRIADLPVGEVYLRAVPNQGGDGAAQETGLVLRAGETVRWDPTFEAPAPGAEIAGRVVTLSGTGMEEYRDRYTVVAEPEPPARAAPVSRITSEGGKFRMAVPWERARLLVYPNLGGRGFPVATLDGVARGTEGVELRVDERALSGLRARLVDTAGRPVDATLQIWHDDARVWREVPAKTGTGAIEVVPMPPGRCTLEVRSADHPWLRLGEKVLPAGSVLDLGDVVLEPGGHIEGSVAFVDGGAPGKVTLRFVDEAVGREVGVAEAHDGRYASSALPLGSLVMVVEGDGIAAARLPVALDAATPLRVVDLSIERGVPVTLRLGLPPSMERPAWLNVGVFREQKAVWTRGVGRAAGLEVPVFLAPGTYRVLVQSNQPLADVPLEVRGAPVVLDVPLRAR